MKKKKKFETPFFTKMVIETVSAAIMAEFVKPALKFGVEAVKSKTLYTVDISDSRSFVNVTLAKIFKNYPSQANLSMAETGYGKQENIVGPQNWNIKNDYIDMTLYDGVPIFISIISKTAEQAVGNNGTVSSSSVKLITLNHPYCRCAMNEFLHKLKAMTVDHEIKNNTPVYLINPMYNHADVINMKLRTFHDVFIPNEQKELLMESIDAYIARRQWYIENNIPNHFGILLYSEPGTGKSSIVQAIASHVNGPLYVASGDRIGDIYEIIASNVGRHAFGNNQYRVMVFEDVDSGLFNLTRDDDHHDDEKEKKRTGLATILNALDGIGSPTNIIYVFTTNHIERLDPALIRPGRCDLKLEIPCATHETLEQFIKFHYGTDVEIDRCLPIKEHLTFAELQTHVMRGDSIDQLLDYCTKGVEDYE